MSLPWQHLIIETTACAWRLVPLLSLLEYRVFHKMHQTYMRFTGLLISVLKLVGQAILSTNYTAFLHCVRWASLQPALSCYKDLLVFITLPTVSSAQHSLSKHCYCNPADGSSQHFSSALYTWALTTISFCSFALMIAFSRVLFLPWFPSSNIWSPLP